MTHLEELISEGKLMIVAQSLTDLGVDCEIEKSILQKWEDHEKTLIPFVKQYTSEDHAQMINEIHGDVTKPISENYSVCASLLRKAQDFGAKK